MGKYTEQIERLTEHPDEIYTEWGRADGLFKYASKTGRGSSSSGYADGKTPGCLTMVRRSPQSYAVIFGTVIDQELTDRIVADKRIPTDEGDITPEHLPVFEYYQELIDQKIAELQ